MGNTLSLHRERQRAVCPFVYAIAFGHFLPAPPPPLSHEDAVFSARRGGSRAGRGGRKKTPADEGADVERAIILQYALCKSNCMYKSGRT